ncbi:ARM repeat-containing protein [Xylariaceae sp. FL0255]|nr:ARM repeat-containing protein [Xylariaceae sp. FL0255]
MAGDTPTARNQFFKELKPRCVSINDLAVRAPDKKACAKPLLEVTDDLSQLLERQVSGDASVFDEKLADYIFFPLSNILRNQTEYPYRLTEVTVKCFRILVDYGWKSRLPNELAQQLLLLLTFIIGGMPGQERAEGIPEETELEAFRALTSLIRATGSSPGGSAALVAEKSIPSLGHAITVMLDGITDGRTPALQLEAIGSLNALVGVFKDQTVLATFLPGIVSSLSRLLSPPSSSKTQSKVLVHGLDALQVVLTKVLGDLRIRNILNKMAGDISDEGSQNQVLSVSWLKATTAKVKLALASILKLRNHASDYVQSALDQLCITLLDECHQSLSDAAPILVETAIILADDSEDDRKSVHHTSLVDLASIYPELTDVIKTTVYNWITSLPRLVQSSEEKIKQQAMRNLLKGQFFIKTLQIDSSILDDFLATSLRDATMALVLASKSGSGLSELPSDALVLGSTVSTNDAAASFQPVLIARETERSIRGALLDLVSKIGSPTQQVRLANDMLGYVRESDGSSRVTSYWLAFELIKASLTRSSDLDDLLDLGSGADASDESEMALQELYTFSVAMLDSQAEAEDIDPRMQALALEITTYTAYRMGEAFRPELIDVLYPIATFLGSDVPQLREHAIVSLNNIAAVCEYPNVTDLIIDNVDYMVNSVSLGLNTFDISPASTQVLKMMVKLTGPRLIPYLDDVVASIFAALENYHGYTIFVESLFGVLTEIVQQATRSANLFIEDAHKPVLHRKATPKVTTAQDLGDILDGRLKRQKRRREEELADEEIERCPPHAFKAAKVDNEVDEEEPDNTDVEKPEPPKTPTFLLLSRITDLTQHYLTSPTPTLRKSLLNLLAIAFPALAPDENAFLPLVNDVWPVLMERLYDPETFVVIAASEALCALCASAGDFLNTRLKTEWWDNGLGKWCQKTKAKATNSSQGPRDKGKGKEVFKSKGPTAPGSDGSKDHGIIIPILAADGQVQGKDMSGKEVTRYGGAEVGLGRFAQAAQAWDAAQNLLVAIVSHVQIDDDMFDQILALLCDDLDSRPEARTVLETVDADAVWLALYERGKVVVNAAAMPVMPGVQFVRV